jgi:Rrf2 family cysteine metabolism transcriptional repressor
MEIKNAASRKTLTFFSFFANIHRDCKSHKEFCLYHYHKEVSPMRLSTRGRYAARAMYDLALQQRNGPIPLRSISARQEISEKYLEQLFLKLRRKDLVRSVRGPGGGYLLGRDPQKITMGEILRAVEGPLTPVFCVDDPPGKRCKRAEYCRMRKFWRELGQRILDCLDAQTLGDLCSQPGSSCAS